MRLHWESWLLRLVLLALLAYQLIGGNTSGAVVAGEGFVVSLLPLLVARLSKLHIPWLLEFAYTVGIALQFISESTKLFELFTYWDKLVHPTLIALTAMCGVWLMLGYRDAFHKRIPIQFAALFALLLGMCVGACWEFFEFGSDWFGDANLQKSNADTVTDMLSNDLGAFVATLFGLWVYTRHLSPSQREDMGRIAAWLAHGPSVLLDRHGRVVGTLLVLLFGAVMFSSQWIDRDTPALASGLAAGQPESWTFSQDPNSAANTRVLSGDWVPDARGICRVNPEHPKPGSEKMGLLELAPGSGYGQGGQPFSVQARYYEERPPLTQGTEMDAGIAFGVRDPLDFGLLEQSALHDVIRLDRYVHGNRRDIREELLRTHADEWHVLKVDVAGANVGASIDGRLIFAGTAPATDGGVALWARAAAATCFSDVQIVLGATTSGN
jgi:hypothetical protein